MFTSILKLILGILLALVVRGGGGEISGHRPMTFADNILNSDHPCTSLFFEGLETGVKLFSANGTSSPNLTSPKLSYH